jgi:2-keto-4-pentenoate hydratase/2-oxohepta-3-ene-1,7-dioic acid hydratase in catechol pathway
VRIATYFDDARVSHAAFVIDGRLVPAAAAAKVGGLDAGDPACGRELLELGTDTIAALHEAAGGLSANGDSLAFEGARLAPPVRTPEKILCAGLNYHDHAAEADMEVPPAAPIFCKFNNALVAHNEPIIRPWATKMLDWEGELLVVIGKEAKEVDEAGAIGAVFGVTIMNDVTARDLQFMTTQWFAGKGLDTFAPCGPDIVSLDEVGSLDDLRIITRHNGEIMQDGTTAEMVLKVPALVSYLSTLVTLKPGDLIATGTCSGIGYLMDPQRFMQDGDTVTVEIENVGTLSNPVADPA